MARKAALGLACLLLATALTGCTWTETKRDYPPSIDRPPLGGGHDHGHDHGHQHDLD